MHVDSNVCITKRNPVEFLVNQNTILNDKKLFITLNSIEFLKDN